MTATSGVPAAAGALLMRLRARRVVVFAVAGLVMASGWLASVARAAAPGFGAA